MKKPAALRQGDTIAILSVSGGLGAIFPHRVERGSALLCSMGYKIKEYPSARQILDGDAGTARERARQIQDAFADPEVKAVIATIGGLSANEILPLLDYERLAGSPKIFCGYSDNGALHFALYQKAGLVSFYGPCLMTQFAEYPEPLGYSMDYFLRAVSGREPVGRIAPAPAWTEEGLDWGQKLDLSRPRQLQKNVDGHIWLRPGKARAPIAGGCLYTIHQLRATPYLPDLTGKIVFFETPEGEGAFRGQSPAFVKSELMDLELSGLFDRIAGLVVGRAYGYTPEEREFFKRTVLNFVAGRNYPVLFNADIGHTDPMITIPLGVMATLDSAENRFSLDEAGVV